VQKAQPHIETMPEGVFRDMMTQRLESLAQHRLQTRTQAPTGALGGMHERGKPVQQRTPMRMALAHLVQNPAMAEKVEHAQDFAGLGNDDIQGVEIFRDLVDFCAKRPNITTAQLIELWHEHPALPHLEKLAVWHLPGGEEEQAREFADAVNRIRLGWVEVLLSRVTNVIEQREEYRALQQRQQALKKQLESQEG
jgi:DNA primase